MSYPGFISFKVKGFGFIVALYVYVILYASDAPNGNLLYLYLPNWHANIVKYDDFCLVSSCDTLNSHL